MTHSEYMTVLKRMYDELTDEMEREIFRYVTAGYVWAKEGARASKAVPKDELIKYLVNKRILTARIGADGQPVMPDDRKVRETARELLRRGYPIIADTSHNGYYIAETVDEVNKPREENEKRAKMLLTMNKGYDKVINLLSYEGRQING